MLDLHLNKQLKQLGKNHIIYYFDSYMLICCDYRVLNHIILCKLVQIWMVKRLLKERYVDLT